MSRLHMSAIDGFSSVQIYTVHPVEEKRSKLIVVSNENDNERVVYFSQVLS